jgi:zinc transport system ATP-binding protein
MALIACENVSFAYEGALAVSGVSFEISGGDYLCVVGENGSGKSSLIKGMLRVLAPRGGSVLTGDGLRRNEIGYLPQQIAAQKDFPANVYEIVISGRLGKRGLSPFYSKRDKEAAEENMRRLGIETLRRRPYGELSGGQQRRVLLARALCAAEKILILDEPVAGLDPVVTEELYRLIETLNRETGLTVVMATHDIKSALKYASHILHLKTVQEFFGYASDYPRSEAGKSFLEVGSV